MSFSNVATDDFSGTLGSFTEQNSSNNTMSITSGMVHATSSGSTLTDLAQTMRNTGTFAESQFSEIEVSNFTSASGYFGASVQCTGTGSSRQLYAAYIRGFNKQVTIAQRTSGGTITTLAGPTTITFADNDKLALGFDSSTGKLTVYKNRVAADASLTDVAVSGTAFSGGRPGIVGGGSSSTVKGDNWVGGDLTSGPATPTTATTTSVTSSSATVGASTSESSGTRYVVVTTSATPPALNGNGTGFVSGSYAYSTSSSISGSGAFTYSATGLSASTTYYHHHVIGSGGADSGVLTSSSFTTSAPPASVTAATTYYATLIGS